MKLLIPWNVSQSLFHLTTTICLKPWKQSQNTKCYGNCHICNLFSWKLSQKYITMECVINVGLETVTNMKYHGNCHSCICYHGNVYDCI